MRVLTYERLSTLRSKEFFTIASTPHGEDCTQVTDKRDYVADMMLECDVYGRQLAREFGDPPDGVELIIVKNLHDFGSYYEVGVLFDPDDEQAVEYALGLEEGVEYWDAQSITELTELNHERYRVIKMERRAS